MSRRKEKRWIKKLYTGKFPLRHNGDWHAAIEAANMACRSETSPSATPFDRRAWRLLISLHRRMLKEVAQ